ncbi:MAG: deoxyribose-phosphate aldolase [Clostridia bacterium]|nr:deoxyribose-phosphate aldolase [Clostridia bacterium]
MNLNEWTKESIAALIDHTNLKATADRAAIEKLCSEAKAFGFASVMVNSAYTALCRQQLRNTPVLVGTVVGFPLGQMSVAAKVFEAQTAIADGADEIDYVVNIAEVKNRNWNYLRDEMERITSACHRQGACCKVIFENCYLTKDEIIALAEIARDVKPDFIKTSTGFGTGGATPEDVRLMKETVGGAVKVKAAGGIRDWASCRAMIEAGADRIGASAGKQILDEFSGQEK